MGRKRETDLSEKIKGLKVSQEAEYKATDRRDNEGVEKSQKPNEQTYIQYILLRVCVCAQIHKQTFMDMYLKMNMHVSS